MSQNLQWDSIPRSWIITVGNQQVLASIMISTRRSTGMRGDDIIYLGCERPIIERSENQRPILDIQTPDLLLDVDTFFRWEAWVCELF